MGVKNHTNNSYWQGDHNFKASEDKNTKVDIPRYGVVAIQEPVCFSALAVKGQENFRLISQRRLASFYVDYEINIRQ